jgi:hypothetical protein
MTEHEQQNELEPEELEDQQGEPLPDREVMSLIDFKAGPLAPDPTFTSPVEPPAPE